MKLFLLAVLAVTCYAFSPSSFPRFGLQQSLNQKLNSKFQIGAGLVVNNVRPSTELEMAIGGLQNLELPPVLGGLKAGTKKLVVVTGASSGLGRETTKALLKQGYFVICAVRDPEKMAAVARENNFNSKNYAILELDLASLDSVRKFVFNLKSFKSNRALSALVCNAAVYLPADPKPRFTKEGFEMSMGVNHLGHFLLCQLLLDDMIQKKTKDQRMIIVGSITGNTNTVGGGLVYPFASLGDMKGFEEGFQEPITMADGKPFFGAKAYKDSKICNMMTVSQLHERYHESTGITFSSMYPGCIAETALFREKREWFRKLFPLFMKYVTGGYVGQEEAGERLAQVVSDPRCAKSGVYWSWNGGAKRVATYDVETRTLSGAGGSGGEIFENDQSEEVSDPVKGSKMFELSSKLVGAKWPVVKKSSSKSVKKEEKELAPV
mmetsp:Transcript_16644/g.22018  ORF Transcript_16644/g.22018 Transcript_16644/m.22018 type:complete len:436 (+) Transcript_16644:128-1435(+)